MQPKAKRLNLPLPPSSKLPGEVWRNRRGDKGLHGFPVDLLKHEQDLWAFGDQLTLTAGVELFDTHTHMQLNHG